MHITANDLTDPPRGIFEDISNSYDFSIFAYFQILKWSFFIMLGYFLLSLPNVIIYILGDGNKNYFAETFFLNLGLFG